MFYLIREGKRIQIGCTECPPCAKHWAGHKKKFTHFLFLVQELLKRWLSLLLFPWEVSAEVGPEPRPVQARRWAPSWLPQRRRPLSASELTP